MFDVVLTDPGVVAGTFNIAMQPAAPPTGGDMFIIWLYDDDDDG